ncbi:Complement component 1 Q subcomponent-binding protein, mitochondrial [Orchesella cincta]|uniref:Complement component 1 Q subcomponent-binding protein, mitochondrial n=1 Tax=Orchesella cincta TaxID=48709 RepID=A0A1D2M986_ORCCI|nr:Complement component 1 Q subcomponent-binding protein, mitochondrial [Orchesella cincta]
MLTSLLTRRVGGAVRLQPAIRSLSLSGAAGHFPAGTFPLLAKSQNKVFQLGSASGLLKSLGGVRAIGIRGVHDQRKKGDDELLGFLEEEIANEKKMQRSISVPRSFHSFDVKVDKSEIILSKKFGNEEIIISANVNHSVDAEYGRDGPPPGQEAKEPGHGMKSKPNFDVEVKKGSQTLCFSCSFLQAEPEGQTGGGGGQDDFMDVFVIDEVSIYEGKGKDTDYAVAGDILDGYLYDLFMNFLEDRAINNEFVEKFSDLCTEYEHNLYIELLSNMHKFFK